MSAPHEEIFSRTVPRPSCLGIPMILSNSLPIGDQLLFSGYSLFPTRSLHVVRLHGRSAALSAGRQRAAARIGRSCPLHGGPRPQDAPLGDVIVDVLTRQPEAGAQRSVQILAWDGTLQFLARYGSPEIVEIDDIAVGIATETGRIGESPAQISRHPGIQRRRPDNDTRPFARRAAADGLIGFADEGFVHSECYPVLRREGVCIHVRSRRGSRRETGRPMTPEKEREPGSIRAARLPPVEGDEFRILRL
jgi:hypothetical protein